MKFRVWAGKPTLAAEQGKTISSLPALEAWLKDQQDGQLEVWAGRWWVVSKEARPFKVMAGSLVCDYHPYHKGDFDTAKQNGGFFAFEAMKIAGRVCAMYHASDSIIEAIS